VGNIFVTLTGRVVMKRPGCHALKYTCFDRIVSALTYYKEVIVIFSFKDILKISRPYARS
jgi:hypothetical protein